MMQAQKIEKVNKKLPSFQLAFGGVQYLVSFLSSLGVAWPIMFYAGGRPLQDTIDKIDNRPRSFQARSLFSSVSSGLFSSRIRPQKVDLLERTSDSSFLNTSRRLEERLVYFFLVM